MKLPKTPLRFIFYFIKKQWHKFSLIAFAAIMMALNDSFFPYFLKKIINTLGQFQENRTAIYGAISLSLALLIFFWFFSESCLRLQGIVSIYTFPQFRASIRKKVFDYVQSHSYEFFSSQFSGNIAKKLGDLPTSCQTVTEIICFQFIAALSGVCIVLIMMWLTKPIFTAILLSWLCVHLGITFIFLRFSNRNWEKHSETTSTLGGKIADVFTNILTVRIFAHNQYEQDYLNTYQKQEIIAAKKGMWSHEIMRVCMGASGLALIFAIIFTLLHGWVHHWVTIGDFTQIGMQSFWVLGWVWHVSFQITIFARDCGVIKNALTLIEKQHDIRDLPNAPSILIQKGEIQFQQVNFSYRANIKVFEQLNLTIPAGQKVGLVGFSGSGKSTFVNLILRFYDIQSGHIFIDDQDIAKISQESLRTQIAMIPQDPTLFHRSLIENIRYGNINASDEAVIHAAKLAHCHEFIERLENGYQSLVGERGIKLSGGQRQRIAIARAILKDAPILILDEATSSLDTVTEKLIQESLHTLMKNRTTIVVAHRLSTLADMDRILVFNRGTIVEEGTQEFLLKLNGHFAKLWKMQTNGFLPEQATKNQGLFEIAE